MFSEPATGEPATLAVLDDEPMLADLLTEWVDEKWVCETFTEGRALLDGVDDSVDVVLLDRQLPGLSGAEVLERLRERGSTAPVCLVSGVEPSVDIVDLPLNDYLRKPVSRPELQATIEELLLRRTYHPHVQEFFNCAAKLDAIESATPATQLGEDERYLALKRRADELRQAADATLGRLTPHVARIHDVELDD